MRNGLSIVDAAHEWVGEFNAIPQSVISLIARHSIDSIYEVTKPVKYDRVYHLEYGSGEITDCFDRDGDMIYVITLDEGVTPSIVEADESDFEVDRDDFLPMWGTMWTFGDSTDEYWLEEDGIRIMSECGFRVYDVEDLGYVFGIDGAGYDFYEAHWVPLYKARGLHWHDERVENGEFFIKDSRKAVLYEKMLDYLAELISDRKELVRVLTHLGFTEDEIRYEFDWLEDDDFEGGD